MDPVTVANNALLYLGQAPIELQAGETWDTFTPRNKAHTLARSLYTSARRDMLTGQYVWNFSRVKVALEASDYQPPEARWNLAYVYPADCLKFLDIVDVLAATTYSQTVFPDARSNPTLTIEQINARGLARPGAGALISPTGASLNEVATSSFDWLRHHEIRAYRDATDNRLKRVILTNLPDCVGEYVVDVEELSLWNASAVTAFEWLLASKIGYGVSGKHQEAGRALAFYNRIAEQAMAADANESHDRRVRKPEWLSTRER